jgi:hypothetical protein
MGRVVGLWVYQTLGSLPDPDAVAARAQRAGMRWLTAQAIEGDEVLDAQWLRGMRRATKAGGLRLAVHGFVGRPSPSPVAEARAIVEAIRIAEADFAIVNAEIQYEQAAGPVSKQFVREYRRLKPEFPSYLSSFGRPTFHPSLDWAAWADAGFHGMPQAYENLNAQSLTPSQCVDDWARFFVRGILRPTLGCFEEHGHPRLAVPRLVQSVREVPTLRFNVYRQGTVTDAELAALSRIE